MAVMRVHKTKDYTVMSNTHFRERQMSLKAKGLLSLMFSLPDTWDYSIAGLVAICKENETAIKSTLKELKSFGYLSVTKLMPNETESGRIEYVYDIFETPEKLLTEIQTIEKQGVGFLGVENQGQYNTNNKNTNNKNTNKVITKDSVCVLEEQPTLATKKFKVGEYNNVLISNEEITKLVEEFGEELAKASIEYLSEYIEMKGSYEVQSHYLAIRRWVIEAVQKQTKNKKPAKSKEPVNNIDPQGTYNNVYLTSDEYYKLSEMTSNDEAYDAVEFLSDYLHNNPNKKYASHFNAIKDWVFTAIKERAIKQQELELKEQELAQRKERITRIDERNAEYNEQSGKRISDMTHQEYLDHIANAEKTPTMPMYNWLEN